MFDKNAHVPARLPAGHPPVLLIVIDTEEEFRWDQPFSRESTGTTSIPSQKIVHDRIYDRLGIVPTYVVDWPVATTPAAFTALKALMDSGQCEIGTHLHPWVSPPHTEAVSTFNSYTGNLPKELELQKLTQLTEAITENFQRAPITFKAGRYGLGPHTSAALAQLGYKVDASVVPHTAFTGDGGPDFSAFSEEPYWFGDTAKPLLELPVTTGFHGALRNLGPQLYPLLSHAALRSLRAGGIAARTGLLERIRLTPEGGTAADMQRLAKTLAGDGCQVMTMTYHSPSIVPGHTPYVRDAVELENFLSSIETFCHWFKDSLGGVFMPISVLHTALASNRQ